MRAAFGTEVEEKLKPRLTAWEVVKRVAIGVYNDGFIHAGNLAYLVDRRAVPVLHRRRGGRASVRAEPGRAC